MARFEIDVGPFPLNQRAVDVIYRYDGRNEFVEAGRFDTSVFEIEIPEPRAGEVARAVLRVHSVDDRDDDISPRSRSIVLDLRTPIADSRDPADITFPEPTITQNSGSLEITPKIPADVSEGEFEFQIHHGRTGDAIEDSVFVAFVRANEPIRTDAWTAEEDQKIHVRPVRVEDDRAGDWLTVDFKVGDQADAILEDHGADFSGGTLLPIGTSSVSPLELSAGDLRLRSDLERADFATTTRAQVGDAPRSQFRGTPAFGVYETPLIVFTEAQQVAFEVFPEAASIARKTLTRADFAGLSREEAREVGTVIRDTRLGRLSLTTGGDESPIDIPVTVAVSDGSSPTFTDADFKPAQPGRLYIPRSYKMRIELRSQLGTQVTLNSFRVRRWCYETRGCAEKPMSFVQEETAHGHAVQDPVTFNSSGAWITADASASSTMPAFGVVTEVVDADHFRVAVSGLQRIPGHGLTIGSRYFVSPSGTLTTTEPTGPDLIQPLLTPLTTDTVYIHQYQET